MLSETKEYLRAAASHLLELSEDEKIQLQCEAREQYRMEMGSERAAGKEEGRKEGREEMCMLVNALAKDGRLAELEQAVNDQELLDKLYAHYGISKQEK